MTGPPVPPRIYHITHVDNLASILSHGGLLSDAEMIARGGPQVAVGMSTIKQRRLRLPVKCHAGDYVGDYVPFYFCPRSIMLYLLHMGNHPELSYAEFRPSLRHLGDVDWAAVANPDFRSAAVKEGKQAEFLVQRVFPWHLVERVGVHGAPIQARVLTALADAAHRPSVDVLPHWYF